MVEPLLFSEEEEDEPDGHNPGRDESLFPAGRRLGVWQQLAAESGRHLSQGRSPPLMRRQSLESLGGRITRLSQSDALGTAWGGTWPVPSTQPALGWEDSPHGNPFSGEELLAMALHGEDLAAGCPQRVPGISASRSRAGSRRGSATGGLPRASGARTRGHPTSKPLGLRQQEPPALWGRRGGDITLAVDDVEKEGAGSRQRRAPCSSHRTNTAAGPPGRCRTGANVSSCPGVAECRGQRGKQKAVLPCKRAGGQLVSLRWSLQRSQEGTQALGSGVKGTRSTGDRDRAGLAPRAHIQDTSHRDLTALERMSRQGQGTCAECQEGLEKERRKTLALQEEKLELQKRLRELEHCTRSLLRQRQEALHQLHVLLQKEKVDALWQLQEALEQRLQHLLSHPCEPAVRGQTGPFLTTGTTSACPGGHNPLPNSAAGQSPVLAVVSHALRGLRGLQEQIRHHLGELRRTEKAQGSTSWRKKQCEQRQQREQLCMEKPAALGALKEQLIQRQSEHPHPRPTSSLSLSIVPGLRQRGQGSLELLHHLQCCMQELQLEKTHHSLGNLTVPGRELATTAREELWGHPGTRDSPSATASPKGLIQSKQEVRSSTTEHAKRSSAWWE
ncbi:unnamed protein product [Bubo scandiacus]